MEMNSHEDMSVFCINNAIFRTYVDHMLALLISLCHVHVIHIVAVVLAFLNVNLVWVLTIVLTVTPGTRL